MAASEWRPADHIAARQVWPKKLPNFSGKPREWPKFHNHFVESTKGWKSALLDRHETLSKDGSTILLQLYGRPSLVVKDLVEKVRRTPAPRPEQLDELITFGLAVLHLCDHLTNAELAHYLSNPELLEELVEKLPVTRKLEWVRYSEKCPLPTLKEFGDFMDKLVGEACVVTKYTPTQKYISPRPTTHRTVHRSNVHDIAREPPRLTLGPNSTPCNFCKSTGHKLRQCEMFKNMQPTDRYRLANPDILAVFRDAANDTTACCTSRGQERPLNQHNYKPIELSWTANVKRREDLSQRVSLEISDLPDDQPEGGIPKILIGLENVDLMRPLEVRSGQPGEPIAVKTVLGWAIYGPHRTNDARIHSAIN
uniref:Peptidase aspartic putative domain-containing protein n=1 Tax=Anopheles epiroticus TaxID=199890 RepID=A0A182PX03_9DIPT